ncbi:hypothetical protein ACFOET_01580 [Parapedobacter deserti]|uniref:LPS export ABC transporter periplasmic protein LptC n=1 Tax=Parapedobacter deserti TaxID=1912957 RepID=A0ABV7JDX3_9SPHI
MLIWAAAACNRPEVEQPASATTPYFSLEGYFNSEAARMQREAPVIDKVVSKGGQPEHRTIQINNWHKELALFTESDINKPAWRASYRVDSTASTLTYTSLDPKLRTARITVEKRPDGTVKHIAVVNRVSNMLYQTEEQLDYYPDSVYRINKQQQVRFIGESRYMVSGTIQ